MKKASYRLLQWTMLMGSAAILATACVVTTGDGDDDGAAGDGGTSSTAGKTSTEAGEGGTAGTSTGGSGGTAGSGGSAAGGDGGAGGTVPSYVPGLCEVDLPTPSTVPSCSPSANDVGDCKICLKARCCTDWQTCYGDEPKTACGWGAREEDPGQFDCIQNCYLDTPNGSDDLAATLGECEMECLGQCAEKDDGFALTDTQALLGCAQDECLDECFPVE